MCLSEGRFLEDHPCRVIAPGTIALKGQAFLMTLGVGNMITLDKTTEQTGDINEALKHMVSVSYEQTNTVDIGSGMNWGSSLQRVE